MLAGMSETFLLAFRNLRRNKLRTLLTLLGMIFGVGSVIAMLSVGAGAQAELLARIKELGVNNVIVNSIRPPQETRDEKSSDDMDWIDRFGLTESDRQRIERLCPNIEQLLSINLVPDRVWYGSSRVDATIMGVPPRYIDMFGLRPSLGRKLSELDEASAETVCMVRRSLLRKLGVLEEPLGLTLRLGSFPYQVIGVLEDVDYHEQTRTALNLAADAHEVFIPHSSSLRTFGHLVYKERAGTSERTRIEVDRLIAVTTSAHLVPGVARVIDAILEYDHAKRDYEIVVPLSLLEQQERTQRVFSVVMVLIASISLIVGGIGIANIMLATVTERTREIGIRRAMGATRSDVMLQFLTETVAIGLIGGMLGCAFGFAALAGIVRATGWNAAVGPAAIAISLSISCAVAVVSGLYPARRGALLDPIQALR